METSKGKCLNTSNRFKLEHRITKIRLHKAAKTKCQNMKSNKCRRVTMSKRLTRFLRHLQQNLISPNKSRSSHLYAIRNQHSRYHNPLFFKTVILRSHLHNNSM
jgi:hypothetical protein